ncbi:putative anoctamin 6 [Trypoxylus dichotomus]
MVLVLEEDSCDITETSARSCLVERVFNTNDYQQTPDRNLTTNITTCYYHGKRYPPDHPKKYALTEDYFYQLIGQLAFVIIFEHVVVLMKVVLSYISEDVPRFVRDRLRMQETRLRDERMRSLTADYKRTYSRTFSKSIILPEQDIP